MKRAAPALALGALFWVGGCARLPEIDSGECGNAVVEEHEDCDSFASSDGSVCRPPGSAGQCHYDCSRQADGSRPACPAGWGCDVSGICGRPSGDFESLREAEVGGATLLASGDFDGDGRADVASFEPVEGLGSTRMRFHYFDAEAQLVESHAFPPHVIGPSLGDLSGDGRTDVLFSDTRVGVLLGRADRAVVPETFSSYRVDQTHLRTLSVFAGDVAYGSGFVNFGTLQGVSGIFATDTSLDGRPRTLAVLPANVEQFAGDPVSGHVIEDLASSPCAQALVAFQGDTQFWIYDVCTFDPTLNGPRWRDQAAQTGIALDPPAAIDTRPLLVDVNADGHLDALIGAGGRTYVAYGDGQGLATAVPYALVTQNAGTFSDVPMPLAVGDITGDGAPDFVTDNQIVLSSPHPGGGFDYTTFDPHTAGYWTAAAIADLNGNGHLDAIAASTARPGVDFYNGTGTPNLNTFNIPTDRPVAQMAVGDFDGDLLTDLALSEIDPSTGSADSLFIAFGSTAGPPETPTRVAQIAGIEQMMPFRENALDHLALTSSEQADGKQRGVLTLLVSNGDRIPMALYELTSFAADSSTNASSALRVSMGQFVSAGQGDVLALAIGRGLTGELLVDQGLEFWLLPALLTSDGTPVKLNADLDPDLLPWAANGDAGPLRVACAAGDFANLGRDQLLLAMPQQDDQHCALVSFAVDTDRLTRQSRALLDEPCTRLQLAALDADADGFLDLVLLDGSSDASSGQVSILWNDGNGGFDASRRSLISSDAPSAFAVLPATPARPTSIAYTNPSGVFLASASAQDPRAFSPPSLLAARSGCTGIVAADLNGDGAADLAFAADGNLNVLRAVLEAP